MPRTSRREFIQNTALAASALSLTGTQVLGANEKINVGVVGLRNRGPQVADAMLANGQFNIAAICDVDRDFLDKRTAELKEKQGKGPKVYGDVRKLLEDKDIDVVVNATPDHWHCLVALMALDAGKHVYQEKPASYNIEEGKLMVAAQERHPNLVVAMGTQQRSGEHFKDVKQFIDEGGLGRIAFARAVQIHMRHLVPSIPNSEPPKNLNYDLWLGPAAFEPYNQERVHYNWHFMKNTGTGDAGNWGAHWLDLLVWYLDLGFPKTASGQGLKVVDDAKEWPDTQTTLYEYPDLTVVWEQRLWSKFGAGGGTTNGCLINGEKGSIMVNRGGWSFHPNDDKAEGQEHGGSDMMTPHIQNFVACIREGAQPAASIQQGCLSATLCHLANITTVTNSRVEFDAEKQVVIGSPEAESMMGRDEYRGEWNPRRLA
ncbi:MAG: Gfo/Idh/MocA family oxidoreductase [Candidatus Omnitrophica bacterium]|nr:Gfo/Idh/MocA family oxidoreductase [Candidatus Omnitrophota bacterium]